MNSIKTLSFLFLILFLVACSNSKRAEQQLAVAQKQLQQAEQALLAAEALITEQQSAKLIHIVLLNVKDDLSDTDLEILRSELKRIGTIDLVHDFELGSFADVGDQRALSSYEIVMKMGFTSREEMAKYQVDVVHEEVRSKLGAYLAGPPVVYDYLIL